MMKVQKNRKTLAALTASLAAVMLISSAAFADEDVSLAETDTAAETSAVLTEPLTAESTTDAESAEIEFPFGLTCSADAEEIDISAVKHSQIAETAELLSQMTNLKLVHLSPVEQESGEVTDADAASAAVTSPAPSSSSANAGSDAQSGTLADVEPDETLTWADVAAIEDACGEADVEYRFEFLGYEYSTLDETFDLNHLKMDDNGAAVMEILPCMRKCKVLDMDFCGVDDAHMEQIRDAYPNIEVIWRIWFGSNCSVRTDVERILASNLNHNLNDANSASLKYCTKLKYLDIGHQQITDISFMADMKDLEVCIIAINPITDISPIANCTKLEYLEIAATYAYDLSPLASLTNLEYLAMVQLNGTQPVEHWEALQNLTKLKKLWIGQYFKPNISDEELAALREALPDTEINVDDPTLVCGWRYNVQTDWSKTERYILLCQQFEYDNYGNVSSELKNDPRYYAHHEKTS